MEQKKTFASGTARLNAIFAQILEQVFNEPRQSEDADREEISCERCNEWPCVCGEPEAEERE